MKNGFQVIDSDLRLGESQDLWPGANSQILDSLLEAVLWWPRD